MNWLGADPEAWRAATRVPAHGWRLPVVDLSDALDGERGPVMYDFVHTNEAGRPRGGHARIYERLLPQLRG